MLHWWSSACVISTGVILFVIVYIRLHLVHHRCQCSAVWQKVLIGAQRLIILWLTGTITRFLVLTRDACMLARSQLQDSHTSHHVIAQVLFPSPSPPKSLFAVSINCWFVGTSTNSDDTDSLKRIKNVSRTPSWVTNSGFVATWSDPLIIWFH